YHTAEFPALARVHRTTFARQAANLFRVKQLLQARLAERLSAGQPARPGDGMPVEACKFAPAPLCRRPPRRAHHGHHPRLTPPLAETAPSTPAACTSGPAAAASSRPTNGPRRGPATGSCCRGWPRLLAL